jgi:hypothetical protein
MREDSVLDFVLDLGHDYFDLLGSVRSEYLSVQGVDRLLNAISIDELDIGLWSRLCCRLRLAVTPLMSSIPATRYCGRVFRLDPSRPLDGILSHLTRECGGNVHTQGLVAITASSNQSNQCYQTVDWDWTGYWCSANEANTWIRFDFKDRRISLTDYTIKSHPAGSHFLLQWSIEGSNDGISWSRVDHQQTRDLAGSSIVKSYHCEAARFLDSSSFFRFIRLLHTGLNSSNCNNLLLTNMEFFGTVSDLRRD